MKGTKKRWRMDHYTWYHAWKCKILSNKKHVLCTYIFKGSVLDKHTQDNVQDINEGRLKWNQRSRQCGRRWLEKSEVNERKKSRSLLWWVTLTRSRCAQCQSIRHPALLLMSTGNKSEEAGLYFAAWVTCRSRHRPMCPCILPQLTSPRLSFTRWECVPIFSLLFSILSICYADSFFFFHILLLSQSLVFIKFFIYLKCFSCLSVCRVSACICAW